MRNHNSNIYSTATNEAVIANEYWNWNALTPGTDILKTGTGDPCSRVYPIGTWRLPTSTELTDVFTPLTAINYAGSTDPARFMYRDGLAGTINGVNYDLEGSDRRVSFINYGFRNSATLNTTVSISNFNANGAGHGYYWSSTAIDGANGAVMQVVHNGNPNATSNNGTTYNTSIQPLNKNFGASVRCVRTAASL